MTQRILFLLLSLAVSGSLVIVLTLVICRLTDKKLSYQWQYYLWILAAARLLLPFAPAQNLMGSLAENITGLMRNISVQDVYTEDAEKVFIPADIHKGAETQGKQRCRAQLSAAGWRERKFTNRICPVSVRLE